MKIYSKEEMESVFGKHGIFSGQAGQQLITEIKYFGGLKIFDDIIEKEGINKESLGVYLDIRPKGLQVKLMCSFSFYRTGIFFDKIQYCVIEPQEQIIAQKEKSIIGRALVGGLLLGPVGAVVAGMTGIGKKNINLNDVDNIISIAFIDENDTEQLLLFSCSDKKVKKVQEYFKSKLGHKFKNPSDIKPDKTTNPHLGVADELLKLKELLDKGVLTHEEFAEMKKKILNN